MHRMDEVKVYAPASIGNIGPGFDVLGLAVSGMGDVVRAALQDKPVIEIVSIKNDGGRLPLISEENTVSIAAKKVLDAAACEKGLTLVIEKGVPFPSGLGSSAAGAVAGGFAANRLLGDPLAQDELLHLCTEAEAAVSGAYFADNTAAALLGGGVVTRHVDGRCEATPLGGIPDAAIVLATPDFPMPTKESRNVLPKTVSMENFVYNMGAAAAVTAAICRRDTQLLGRSIDDRIVEPARAKLIPGFPEVKKAALDAGALGCSISGGGPTLFAIVRSGGPVDAVGDAMKKAFKDAELNSSIHICGMDIKGARQL